MRSQKHTAMWGREIAKRFYNTAPLVLFFLNHTIKTMVYC